MFSLKTIFPNLIALAGLLVAAPGLVSAAPGRIIDATKVGVVGNGTTVNTASIQKAIDDCAATGGGTVSFPAGRYLTGTIQIKSNVTLHLDDQATLLGSTDATDYRNLDPFIDGSGTPQGYALIIALDASNVGLEGKGTVDGQSPALRKKQNPYTVRPFLVRWVRCANVAVRDVHLVNPGAWTMHFFQSKGIVVEGVTIRSRNLGIHNLDGIDIDSSEGVRVSHCDVISGDDALVIKATGAGNPSRDIQVTDCQLSSHTNAIKLGTESIGGFEDIAVSGCKVTSTDMAGIALYQVDGSFLRRVTISDVTMDGVTLPICIRLGARLKSFREGDQPKAVPGELRDVAIRNVNAKNIGMIGLLLNGIPGHAVEAVTLENVSFELPGGGTAEDANIQLSEKEKAYPEFNMFGKTMPAYGIYARHVRGIKLLNVHSKVLAPDARPATIFVDVADATPANFATAPGSPPMKSTSASGYH